VRVVAEFAEHPGAEDESQSGLGQVDLSVRVAAKIRLHLALQGLDLFVEGGDRSRVCDALQEDGRRKAGPGSAGFGRRPPWKGLSALHAAASLRDPDEDY
jgi:hypothetical protein